MSGNSFLLDTNAVLYILNGDETLSDFLFEKELYLSIISEMELLSYKKITAEERISIELFISELVVINIDERIKQHAIDIKKATNLKLPDSIIAATSLSLKLALITSDKNFKHVGKLNLVYYEK